MCHPASAVAGSDYTMAFSPLEFPAGATTADMECVSIIITEDTAFEGDETFTVWLNIVTNRAVQGNAVTTISITDNEGGRHAVSFRAYIFSHMQL